MSATDTVLLEDAALERRVATRVFIGAAGFLLAIGLINAFSLLTEAERYGWATDPREPFVLEFTSVLAILALVPLIALFERRFRFTSETWLPVLGWHVLGSIGFSLLHVALFVLLRSALYPLVLGEAYAFGAHLPMDLIYEYRKDLLPYAVIVLLLGLQRGLEEHRREAAALRAVAQKTGRLTLKSGGRTLSVDARAVEWVSAAGNYVEIHGAGGTQLARIPLATLETQLREAGADMVRVHRSHLVNRTAVRETIPTGDGDFRVRLASGTELRGSRRYRGELD